MGAWMQEVTTQLLRLDGVVTLLSYWAVLMTIVVGWLYWRAYRG